MVEMLDCLWSNSPSSTVEGIGRSRSVSTGNRNRNVGVVCRRGNRGSATLRAKPPVVWCGLKGSGIYTRIVATWLIGRISLGSGGTIARVAPTSTLVSVLTLVKKHRYRYRCQNPDDDHDHQKLDEREALLVFSCFPHPASKPVQHLVLLLLAFICFLLTLRFGPHHSGLDTTGIIF